MEKTIILRKIPYTVTPQIFFDNETIKEISKIDGIKIHFIPFDSISTPPTPSFSISTLTFLGKDDLLVQDLLEKIEFTTTFGKYKPIVELPLFEIKDNKPVQEKERIASIDDEQEYQQFLKTFKPEIELAQPSKSTEEDHSLDDFGFKKMINHLNTQIKVVSHQRKH